MWYSDMTLERKSKAKEMLDCDSPGSRANELNKVI